MPLHLSFVVFVVEDSEDYLLTGSSCNFILLLLGFNPITFIFFHSYWREREREKEGEGGREEEGEGGGKERQRCLYSYVFILTYFVGFISLFSSSISY